MSKKMIFFDIDGTLYDENKQLPGSTRDAIHRLRGKGHEIAISTGRAPYLFDDLREELDIHTFISFNGQFVKYNGNAIYQNTIPTGKLQSLQAFAAEKEHPIVFMGSNDMKANIEFHHDIHDSITTLGVGHPEFDASFAEQNNIYQALLFAREDEENRYVDQMQDLRFVRWHPYSLDVIPPGGSKANGIKNLIAEAGIELEDCYAFGDNYNDVEMLQYVPNSVAMGNAPDEVKSHARHITADVGDDGIARGLEKVGLL